VPKLALAFGAALIAVGVWAYTASGPGASPTALIPAAIGLLIAIAGLVGLQGGATRKHAMHAAAAVALVGALGSVGQLVASPAAGSEDADIAGTAGLLNLVLCLAFVALAVRSFVAARRARI
jgi:Co/Zn/Cd efflux system component